MSSGLCIRPGCVLPRQPGSMFCRVDEGAASGKRGGWLSAYKRNQRGGGGDAPLDAHNIVRRLWIGGKPPADRQLPMFDVVVLCAQEYQPLMPHVGTVVRVPIDDAELDAEGLRRALLGAREVAQHMKAGKTVLVTCYAGRNRSALVACLALALLTRMSADRMITLVRARRHPGALSNPHFRNYLRQFVGRGRAPAPRR